MEPRKLDLVNELAKVRRKTTILVSAIEDLGHSAPINKAIQATRISTKVNMLFNPCRLLIVLVSITMVGCVGAGGTTVTSTSQSTQLPELVVDVGTDTPFETIEQTDFYFGLQYYTGKSPHLMVIGSVEERLSAEIYLSPVGQEKLKALDFKNQVAFLLFHGSESTLGYGVTIHKISHRDNAIFLFAELWTRGAEGEEVGLEDGISSPFHVAVIERPSAAEAIDRVVVIVDGNELIHEDY